MNTYKYKLEAMERQAFIRIKRADMPLANELYPDRQSPIYADVLLEEIRGFAPGFIRIVETQNIKGDLVMVARIENTDFEGDGFSLVQALENLLADILERQREVDDAGI